jgi:hypothetical protein
LDAGTQIDAGDLDEEGREASLLPHDGMGCCSPGDAGGKMSRKSERFGLAFPLYIQASNDAVRVVDRVGVTAAYVYIGDDPERREPTGRVSREQGIQIAMVIVRALTDETL